MTKSLIDTAAPFNWPVDASIAARAGEWLRSKRWVVIKFVAMLVAVIALNVVMYRDIDVQRHLLSEHGVDLDHLAMVSRTEKEFDIIYEEADLFAKGAIPAGGNPALPKIRTFRERLASNLGELSYLYPKYGIDESVLRDLEKGLDELTQAAAQLRWNEPPSVIPIEYIWRRYQRALSDFDNTVYRVRLERFQGARDEEQKLLTTFNRYQNGLLAYSVGLSLLILFDFLWSSHMAGRLRQSRSRIIQLAETDPLTQIYNRQALDRELLRRLALGQYLLTLVCIDIDRFHSVNDSFGQNIGDRLLAEVARRLERESAGGFLGRVSGDEFVLLLGMKLEHAMKIAERIRQIVFNPIDIGDRHYQATASIGVVHLPHERSREAFALASNAAMAVAKAAGGDRVVAFEPDMLSAAREKALTEADLGRAIAAGALEIAIQPKCRLSDGSITGYEALARWKHPVLGWVSPEKFARIADSIGLSSAMGNSIADLAFQALSKLRRENFAGRMSINVSPAFGSHPDFEADMLRLMAKHGLESSDVELEVTEEAMLADIEALRNNMAAMRARGTHIAIDDFGKGFSNLNRLTKLKVSVIKTDKSLIDSLASDKSARAVIRGLVQIARDLDIELIVEGVETQEQASLLRKFGVIQAQGYLFSRPLSPDQLLAWLQQRSAVGSA